MTTFKPLKKLPEVVAHDFSQTKFPKQKLAYDKDHRLVIVDDGFIDVQARIDANAANCPSLADICANMPGDSPLDKLQSALDMGVIPSVEATENDFTEVPEHISDIYRAGVEARAIVGKDGDLEKLINELVEAKLAEAKAASETKGEEK